MPAKSPAQERLMQAAAHTKGGYGGVPQKVGEEFVGKDALQSGPVRGIADRVRLLGSRMDAAEQRDLRRDEWSPEAREAAARARKSGSTPSREVTLMGRGKEVLGNLNVRAKSEERAHELAQQHTERRKPGQQIISSKIES